MCQFMVQKEEVEQKFKVKFDEYFAFELKNLQHFANEGLVRLYPDRIVVTPKENLLVRAVAMNFDEYLREDEKSKKIL